MRRSGCTAALHAPDLIFPELGNALWRRVRCGDVQPEDAEVALRILTRGPLRVHATGPLAGSALRLAVDLDHPVYDAIYLALARSLDVPLVTADRRLAAKVGGATAGKLGIAVLGLADL